MTRTPAQHYNVAELLLDRFDDISAANPHGINKQTTRTLELILRRAQVHATLAVVTVIE